MGGGGKDNLAPTVSLPRSSYHLLGLLNQPETDRSLELYESDVIWPSDRDWDLDSEPDSEPESDPGTTNSHTSYNPNNPSFGLSAVFAEDRGGAIRRPTRPVIGSCPDTTAMSAPVSLPMWHVRKRLEHVMGELEEKEMEEEDDEEMVPPHMILARSHVMRFSVFEGVGRTLKGRDLRRVRNAVLQQTGFLDL